MLRNSYGCDLDQLDAGSRIGIMVTADGELHYYINGVDQGAACTGLPRSEYLAIRHVYYLTEQSRTPDTTQTTQSA